MMVFHASLHDIIGKEKNMQEQRVVREYETVYVMRPAVNTEEVERVGQRVTEVMNRLQGKLTNVSSWGKRKLAYPVSKSSRGVFVYLKYVGGNDLVRELERNLRLLDSVVRYQTIRLSDVSDMDKLEVSEEQIHFKFEATEGDDHEPSLEERLGFRANRNRDYEQRDPDDQEGIEEESVPEEEPAVEQN